MTGPVSKRDLFLVGLLGALLVNLVLAFHIYDAGKRSVMLKQTKDSLARVVQEKAVLQHQRDSIGKALLIADQKSEQTRAPYVKDTGNVKVGAKNADGLVPVFDSTGTLIQEVDPRIADRITHADEHISSLESQLATAKMAFRIDTLFIAKGDEENKLNKSIADQTKGSRVSLLSLQLGSGVCDGPNGFTGCVYAGVGVSVRIF